MKTPLPPVMALAVSLLLAPPLWATCGGGGGGGTGGMAPRADVAPEVYQVPWKLVGPDQPAPTAGLVLYWFPASTQEIKDSGLRTSRNLALWAAQCVSMQVADASWPIGTKLEAAGQTPVVVLANADGTAISRAAAVNGTLKAEDVEQLVREELKKRESAIRQHLSDGKAKAKAGDNAAAVEEYKAVWSERCLFPGKAKDAAKALKKLGAPVPEDDENALFDFSPVWNGERAAAVVSTMKRGLAAENAGHYDEAVSLYARACRLDPDDPTPARYLAETYRHHTGEWKKARAVFEAMLRRPIDPLSKAVALHGIGKMTIHEGAFDKGRELFEASVEVFPLPLTYRNLAVYWNSEGDQKKAGDYVQKALDLDPTDAYNRVFSAVFFADTGRAEEALQLARDNEGLMAASYNLAAIYAQTGDRERALRFLKRHFYEYERYDAVRAEEMMEARVDAVFASLRNDPEFLELTNKADGMLPMPMTAH
jgi:tetratricopeptide (TPR) repeat protein